MSQNNINTLQVLFSGMYCTCREFWRTPNRRQRPNINKLQSIQIFCEIYRYN